MTAFIWAILGILLIASEFIIPGVFIMFFGFGAIITSVLSLIIPGFAHSLVLQLLSLGITSTLSITFLRKRFANVFRGKLLGNDNTDDVGKKATVVENISPDKPGRIKYQGTSWKAITYDDATLKENEEVEILSKENLTYIVTKSLLN